MNPSLFKVVWLHFWTIKLVLKYGKIKETMETDNRSLFITEIPLEAKVSDIAKAFEPFGPIKKIALKPNPNGSGHNGRAFLDFESAQSASECLQNSRNSLSSITQKMLLSDAISILGTPVVVKPFIPKQEILSRHEKVDKQNKHLLYEGRITASDEAAIGVPKEELLKRKKYFEADLERLNDTNNKVSETRLCVRNLPKTAGTGQIRKIFAIAPKKYARTHKKDPISHEIDSSPVRIIDVRKKEGQDDIAFVEFTKHEHALGALRHLNNNPNYFTDRRLIVTFSITNNLKIKRMKKKKEEQKRLREQRFASRESPAKDTFDDDDDEAPEFYHEDDTCIPDGLEQA